MKREIATIVTALEREADLCGAPVEWNVTNREQQGKVWKVFLEPNRHSTQIDESLEGSAAWWPGPPRGTADVLSVVPEELQVNLRYATAPVPGGGKLKIFPVRFLDKLAEAWSSPFRGPRFYDALQDLMANGGEPLFPAANHKWFTELRDAQRDAFRLPAYRSSYLWGPPGTGKTHTLGAVIAGYLLEHPDARVLLVSTTNTAVDLALVSVDKALERLSKTLLGTARCRRGCKRVGVHFGAQHYQDRQHLLPYTNGPLIQALAALESSRPDGEDLGVFESWKSSVDSLRGQMQVQLKEILASSRLVALTCTRAMFSYAQLEEEKIFDLVVFDEASQVGLAHAAPFLPLGKRILFAGDPMQLAPIVVSDEREVREWIGRSPFDFMHASQPNTVTLTEQSRMHRDICRVIADTFYGGKLTVCAKANQDPEWHAGRELQELPGMRKAAASCLQITSDGRFHPAFRGYVRYESADKIVRGVQAALSESSASDIAVLTPYRAQRTLIRKKLQDVGIRGVQVSTVHRAQGSEKRTIFFDPVLGTHRAVTDQLINVALSRAKARLVIALSSGDLRNPRLARIRMLLLEQQRAEDRPVQPISPPMPASLSSSVL